MNDDEKVVYMGETDARNRRVRFGIKRKDRSRHLYAIGKTGMGKSTLLENLAVQDIQNGDGVCFIDPHGKSADLLLEYVPKERIKDVIYFAPFDMDYPVSFNVMEDVGPEKRYLVASGLMAAFKKIWVDAWSARMEYILGNIMLALLEYPGSTLVGVNRMLTDKDFRKEVVSNITDPSVKSFWVNEYASYTDKFAAEAAPAIQNKVGQFIANPLIRNIIGQPNSSFDIRKVMDEKKILIINLSKGRVGEANANLLGSMLITKIYLGAMSRADLSEKELAAAPNFYLYVDEFQSFANESFADILSEARKYKLNLHIAHQYIEQMTDEVRAAVFGNVGTMCVFRVGATDAEAIEKEFAPTFTAEEIVNLQKYQMYLKLMIDGVTSSPFSASGLSPIPKPEISYVKEIMDSSRSLYARPRQQIEEELLAWIQKNFANKGNGSSNGGGAGGNGGGNSNSNGSNGGGQDRGNSSRGDYKSNGQRPPQGNGGFEGSKSSFAVANQDRGRGSQNGQNGSYSQRNTPDRRNDRTDNRVGSVPSNGQSVRTSNPSGPQSTPSMSSVDKPSSIKEIGNSAPKSPTNNPSTLSTLASRDNRENELRKAMSLSYLKPEQEKKDPKTPKPENIAALREALLAVMGTSTVAETTALVEENKNTNTGIPSQELSKESTFENTQKKTLGDMAKDIENKEVVESLSKEYAPRQESPKNTPKESVSGQTQKYSTESVGKNSENKNTSTKEEDKNKSTSDTERKGEVAEELLQQVFDTE